MVVEDKHEDTQISQTSVSQEQNSSPRDIITEDVSVETEKVANENDKSKKEVEVEEIKVGGEMGESSSSNVANEEKGIVFDLKEHEKRALVELRSKVEEAILANKLFKENKETKQVPEKTKAIEEKGGSKIIEEKGKENEKIEDKEDTSESKEEMKIGEEKEKKSQESAEKGGEEESKEIGEKELVVQKSEYKENSKSKEIIEIVEENEKRSLESSEKEIFSENGEESKEKLESEEKTVEIIDENISIWGVPLLPSKGDKSTDVVLLKFLKARDFNVDETFEMLKNTLQWRKEFMIDSILDEDFGNDYDSVAYTSGVDRHGHRVCYNVYGIFANDEIYNTTFGSEQGRQKFLRWRLRLMEKEIQKLDFRPGGLSSLLQINDLKNTPGPSRKDLRVATKQAVALLQDNYPEFVARNVFINVPFWYYAFNALLSPFLTQRTKSKFVFARPARVTETLLKYIAFEEIPVQYGGFKRDNDSEFSPEDGVSETTVKAGSTEIIEIPAPPQEEGRTLVWDVVVLGWEVNYKEEFVPTNGESYTLIVQKGRKIDWQEGPLRNSFKNNEAGKLVITIDNPSFKKKRVFYRYKTKLY